MRPRPALPCLVGGAGHEDRDLQLHAVSIAFLVQLAADQPRGEGGRPERNAEAIGDYTAGPSHIMPTSGTARVAA